MNREEIRARIDALECLSDVQQARGEVASVEFEPHESQTFDLTVNCRDDGLHVTFMNNLPLTVLIAGLRAMERELIALANLQEVTA